MTSFKVQSGNSPRVTDKNHENPWYDSLSVTRVSSRISPDYKHEVTVWGNLFPNAPLGTRKQEEFN